MIISMLGWSVTRRFYQSANLVEGRGGRPDENMWNTGGRRTQCPYRLESVTTSRVRRTREQTVIQAQSLANDAAKVPRSEDTLVHQTLNFQLPWHPDQSSNIECGIHRVPQMYHICMHENARSSASRKPMCRRPGRIAGPGTKNSLTKGI